MALPDAPHHASLDEANMSTSFSLRVAHLRERGYEARPSAQNRSRVDAATCESRSPMASQPNTQTYWRWSL